jgi:hypothetical protein
MPVPGNLVLQSPPVFFTLERFDAFKEMMKVTEEEL